jgi:methylated-DNA-[protein]-cysteine S-methyltransferase
VASGQTEKSEVSMKVYYTMIDSPIGKLYVAKTSKGISFLSFSRKEWEKYLKDLKKDKDIEVHKNNVTFFPLKKALRKYFSRKEVKFTFPLDLFGGTSFQRKVWSTMRKIPYGETRSYKWLAQRVGDPEKARAVGQACGSNPLPILIPCHRVIKSDGGLGGFGGGLHIKRKLLGLESER